MKEVLWLALSCIAVVCLMWALERVVADAVEKGIRQSGIIEAVEELRDVREE